MSQTYIRTFLIASAAFLALEAGPVVATLAVRQSTTGRETIRSAGADDLPRTWMPSQLFDYVVTRRSRRDVD
ncbi:MAG TPA: hypothetical protein VL424_05175 [Pararobbsia sp.]|nr:hypothetical protein [Pararobbsia sp.]